MYGSRRSMEPECRLHIAKTTKRGRWRGDGSAVRNPSQAVMQMSTLVALALENTSELILESPFRCPDLVGEAGGSSMEVVVAVDTVPMLLKDLSTASFFILYLSLFQLSSKTRQYASESYLVASLIFAGHPFQRLCDAMLPSLDKLPYFFIRLLKFTVSCCHLRESLS